MPSYIDLQNRIATDLTRTDLASQIQNAIQDAIKHYEHDRFWFNTTRALTFATVNAQSAYGASDLAQIPTLIRIDHLFLPLGNSVFDLDYYEPDQFEYIAANGAPGKPTCYTYVDSQILLWPVPNAVYTLRPHMHYRLSALSNSTDSNAWCNEAEQLIRTHAKLILYMDVLEDNDGAGRMQAKIQSLKDKLDFESSARESSGRIRGTDF